MNFSILPPTRGIRTSTVALKDNRARSARTQARIAAEGDRRPDDRTGDGGPADPGQSGPGLRAPDLQIAVVELVDDAGQPVGPQHLAVTTSTPPSWPTRNASRVASSAPEAASRASQ